MQTFKYRADHRAGASTAHERRARRDHPATLPTHTQHEHRSLSGGANMRQTATSMPYANKKDDRMPAARPAPTGQHPRPPSGNPSAVRPAVMYQLIIICKL